MTVISQGSESDGPMGRLRQLKGVALGSGLGVIVVGVGILLIGIGWNGMAGGGGEINGVPNLNAQLPWLVSGGLLGLAFVVFGSAILVAHNARVDRARLEAKLDEMTAALEKSAQKEVAVEAFTPRPRSSRAPAKKAAAKTR
jgi:low affinity Fe/Cu permease